MQRTVLDAILIDADNWWADQLNLLLRFSKEVSMWSPADEETLQGAITRYKDRGVDDEYDNCSTVEEYQGFRDDLKTLGETLGVPFTGDLQLAEERIAEMERPEPEYRGGGGSSGAHEDSRDLRGDSEAAIRKVFGALLD